MSTLMLPASAGEDTRKRLTPSGCTYKAVFPDDLVVGGIRDGRGAIGVSIGRDGGKGLVGGTRRIVSYRGCLNFAVSRSRLGRSDAGNRTGDGRVSGRRRPAACSHIEAVWLGHCILG